MSEDAAPVPETAAATLRKSGHVKWFDSTKGFGFVITDDEDGDVLLHFSVLTEHGRRMLPEGAAVECDVVQGRRGLQAVKVHSFDVSIATGYDVEADSHRLFLQRHRPTSAIDEFEPVVVKWFNRLKGYGFLNRMDSDEDIFVHMETFRCANIFEIMPQDQLLAKIAPSERGLLAVEILPKS
jgi:cold shock protein